MADSDVSLKDRFLFTMCRDVSNELYPKHFETNRKHSICVGPCCVCVVAFAFVLWHLRWGAFAFVFFPVNPRFYFVELAKRFEYAVR